MPITPRTWTAGELVTAAMMNAEVRDALTTGVARTLAELSGAQASYDFTSIPATFRHLMIVIHGRSDTAATETALRIRLNNSSLANYDNERILAAGATVSATEQLAQTSGIIGLIPGATASSTLMGGHTIWLPHYTNAARVKLGYSQGFDSHNTTTGTMSLGMWGFHHSGLTAAVTRVTLFPAAGSFNADSVATLYGLPL